MSIQQEREYRTVDKADWPRGEWDDEPDKVQFKDKAGRYPCLIVRGPSGALCGYVGVSEGHPAFGRDYGDDALYDVEVHGGLTFAGPCAHGSDESSGICHIPAPGEPDNVWWLGFDCAHGGDVCPSYSRRFRGFTGDSYKALSYVRGEVESLAAQLFRVAKQGATA